MLLVSGWLSLGKRRSVIATPVTVLALALCVGCGGNSSPHKTTLGTPAGSYTTTVAATSGSLNHGVLLTVVVQ